ncbi:uncharacterized protein LOC109830842 [Asparagus officinalis]|uniref:uncharacterized protein LOC109830842 n=1 Tax=Asparagus officinalis TaxID=4686 RepID=UPI00098E4ABD|nr:uncharacterized protein LOC109830842 [Asparagus officinalis]
MIVGQLIPVDITFDDEVQAQLILSQLPDSWAGYVTTISNSAGNEKLKLNEVASMILSEEDEKNRKITRSRDVIFNKEVMYKDIDNAKNSQSNGSSTTDVGVSEYMDLEELPDGEDNRFLKGLSYEIRSDRECLSGFPHARYGIIRGDCGAGNSSSWTTDFLSWKHFDLSFDASVVIFSNTETLCEMIMGQLHFDNIALESDENKKYNAILVVKGFQQREEVDYTKIFSSIVKLTTIRSVLSLVAAEDLYLEQLDVKIVFLHGGSGRYYGDTWMQISLVIMIRGEAPQDRFLICSDWDKKFPACIQFSPTALGSDHSPLVLDSKGINSVVPIFRFERSWLHNPSFLPFISSCWTSFSCQGSPVDIFILKLKLTKKRIKWWNKNFCGSVASRKSEILSKINALDVLEEHRPLSDSELYDRKGLHSSFSAIIQEEETYWHQRSRVQWLKLGDSNTAFFHKTATFRRNANYISCINYQGKELSNDHHISEAFCEYFSSIFGQSNRSKMNLDWSILYPQEESFLNSLDDVFTESEIKCAVFGMNANKAPGPDGFSMAFYQTFWETIKYDLIKLMIFLQQQPSNLHRLNKVFITLIPKTKDSVHMNDFRPISLINCIFKIFSKILANRLSTVIPNLVASTQSAFQSGKSTLDSIIMANEMIHYCSKRRKEVAMFKIDFSKAFDSINWNFLIGLLKARGFGSKWCNWIYHIVSSSSCSVKVNGLPSKFFSCKRGLKQGDPLSPMLFNIAVDALNKMIHNNVEDGLLSNLGIKLPLNQLRILQFADDTLLFVRSSYKDISVLKTILYIFEEVSGLGINYSKSSIVYFGKISTRGQYLSELLCCKIGTLPIKYLGLPLRYGKLRKTDWEPLLDNFHKKLSTWKKNSLSYGGRLVLLNSVLTSIPLYFMSFYKLPTWVIIEIDKIKKSFLWSESSQNSSFKCLVNWKKVCLSKSEGGLGVKDIRVFNCALLAKWLWKYLDPNSHTGIFLRQLYNHRGSLIQILHANANNSSFWNTLISFKEEFFQHIIWTIGSGERIRFWEDKWIGHNSLSSLFPSLYQLALSSNVNVRSQGFFRDNAWHWSLLLRRCIPHMSRTDKSNLLNLIGSYQISTHSDIPIWSLTTNGMYSVKSFYQLLNFRGIKSPFYKVIWKNAIPSKVSVFIWLLSMNKLHTKDNLLMKGWHGDFICIFCGLEPETRDHLFFSCCRTTQVWGHFKDYYLPFTWPNSFDILMKTIENLRGGTGYIWRGIFSHVCWNIWSCRNKVLFDKVNFSSKMIIDQSIFGLVEWSGVGKGLTARKISAMLKDCPLPRASE